MIPYQKVELHEGACNANPNGSWYVSNLIEHTKNEDNVVIYEFDTHSIDLDVYPWGKKLSLYEIINHVRLSNNNKC